MTFRPSLPRSARLPDAAAFAGVFAARQSIAHPCFRLHYAQPDPSDGQASARLGLAVSRRVSARAVDRNRIRRQIRESFRLNRARLPALDLIVVARPAAREASNAELRTALEMLWQRLERE